MTFTFTFHHDLWISPHCSSVTSRELLNLSAPQHSDLLNGEIIILTDSSVGKESACNAGDPGLIPGSGRSAGEGIGYPLQYSWVSLMAQLVKNLPAMQETWV